MRKEKGKKRKEKTSDDKCISIQIGAENCLHLDMSY